MDGADACAGEHRYDELRDHRQVDGDPVPFLDPELFQGVGKAAHLEVKLLVAEYPGRVVLALPDEGGLVLAPSGQVAVEAVVRDVELAPFEPAHVGLFEVIGEDRVPFLEPVQLLRFFRPESLHVLHGFLVNLLVFIEAFDMCRLAQPFRGLELPVLLHHGLDDAFGRGCRFRNRDRAVHGEHIACVLVDQASGPSAGRVDDGMQLELDRSEEPEKERGKLIGALGVDDVDEPALFSDRGKSRDHPDALGRILEDLVLESVYLHHLFRIELSEKCK